jgi:hypothetical protein
MNSRTSTGGETLCLDVTLCDPPVPCACCGEMDTQVPCQDCQAWCDESDWCKARGITRLRLRAGRAFRWLALFVEPDGG